MEKSQKAIKEIAVKDETQMSTLLDSMGHLVEKLNNSYHVMQNFSILAEAHKVPNILTDDILEVSLQNSIRKIPKNMHIYAHSLYSRVLPSHYNVIIHSF